MDTILVKVRLPCSVARLENALLKADHNGHWNDAQVTTDDEKKPNRDLSRRIGMSQTAPADDPAGAVSYLP